MITTIYFIQIWISDTHKTLTARRIFVHCLPINKFLLAVSKCDVPSCPEFFLVPPPLKKDNEDANASFVNRKKLTPLNRKAFSHHWSFNLGIWQRRESFCSTRDIRWQREILTLERNYLQMIQQSRNRCCSRNNITIPHQSWND